MQGCALPRRIGIDEFATRKGHRYATVVVALTRHVVTGVVADRTPEALQSLLCAPGARPEGVQEAVIDMWEPFYAALRTCCVRARIVIDRFHVERHLWQAVASCRKRLGRGQRNRQQRRVLKAARHLFLTPASRLSPQQRLEREAL